MKGLDYVTSGQEVFHYRKKLLALESGKVMSVKFNSHFIHEFKTVFKVNHYSEWCTNIVNVYEQYIVAIDHKNIIDKNQLFQWMNERWLSLIHSDENPKEFIQAMDELTKTGTDILKSFSELENSHSLFKKNQQHGM